MSMMCKLFDYFGGRWKFGWKMSCNQKKWPKSSWTDFCRISTNTPIKINKESLDLFWETYIMNPPSCAPFWMKWVNIISKPHSALQGHCSNFFTTPELWCKNGSSILWMVLDDWRRRGLNDLSKRQNFGTTNWTWTTFFAYKSWIILDQADPMAPIFGIWIISPLRDFTHADSMIQSLEATSFTLGKGRTYLICTQKNQVLHLSNSSTSFWAKNSMFFVFFLDHTETKPAAEIIFMIHTHQ